MFGRQARKVKTKSKEAKGNGKSVRPQETVRGECQKGRVKGSPKALQRSAKDGKRCVLMEAQEREPAARATDFAAEKKKELEESIRAEKKNRATKSRCLEDRRRKAKTKRKEA